MAMHHDLRKHIAALHSSLKTAKHIVLQRFIYSRNIAKVNKFIVVQKTENFVKKFETRACEVLYLNEELADVNFVFKNYQW